MSEQQVFDLSSGCQGNRFVAFFLGLGFSALLFLLIGIVLISNQPPIPETESHEIYISIPPPEMEIIEQTDSPLPAKEQSISELESEPIHIDLKMIDISLNVGLGSLEYKIDPSLPAIAGSGSFATDDLFDLNALDGIPSVAFMPPVQLPRSLVGFLHPDQPSQIRVYFIISKEGTVEEILSVDAPNAELEQFARKTLQRIRYKSGTVDGQAVRFRVMLPLNLPPR